MPIDFRKNILNQANTFTGDQTITGTLTFGSDGSGTDVILHSGTAGDNITWDSSEEVLQITGTDGSTSLDVLDGDVRVVDKIYLYDRGGEYISGNGSTLTLTGATAVSGTLTVGTDGSGTDVILYSGTAGDNVTWDASEEVLQITGTNGATSLDVLDGDVRIVDTLYFYDRGGEYMSSDGSTLAIVGNTTVSGHLFINETAHAQVDQPGLVINQGTGDKVGFALKSSDVDTGLTSIVKSGFDIEEDDYFVIGKGSPATGGVYMLVLGESNEANPFFLEVWSGAPGTSDTTGNAYSPINFFVGQHDGSNGDVDMAANSNLMVWGEIDSSSTRVSRMVLKADDGELHLGNTTLVAFDEEDDIQLVRAMQKAGSSGGILESERGNPFYDYNKLYELGLAGEKDKDGDFLFPLQSRLHAHEGAMWQTHLRVAELEEKLALAESKLAAIGA